MGPKVAPQPRVAVTASITQPERALAHEL